MLQQLLRVFIGAALQKPFLDRHIEALLGPVEHLLRHVPVQQVPQDALADAVLVLEGIRQRPGKFQQIAVKHRDAAFQRVGHAGAVDLVEDIIREIILHVRKLHRGIGA